jgi:pimeloyl-ACP methyl ester carboxylesterase
MEITSGAATLAAEAHGDGAPTVLLVHAGVTDQRSWQHVIDALPDHRCLTYDARGFGRTTYDEEDGWSPVGDAIAVLDAWHVGSAVVVGCSMGGRTSLDLALTHPDRVRGLVLVGSAVSGAPEIDLEPGLEDLEHRYDAAYEAHDLDELNRLEAWIWLDGPFQPEGRVGGTARELFLDMNRIALEAPEPGEQREGVNAWERCGEVRCPTLVMVGEHDLAHTRRNATHLAATVPRARLLELAGVAHLPQLEADPVTLREIAAFAAGLG